MRAYIIRRLLLIVPTILLLTGMVFLMIRLIPGDVLELMMQEMAGTDSAIGTPKVTGAGGYTTEELTMNLLRERLGLDVPIHVQYGRWLGVWPQKDGSFVGIVQGSAGESLWSGRQVRDDIFDRLPVSIELGILAILTSVVMALPIGVVSAIRQDSAVDYIGRSVAIGALSVPAFWIGTMVVLLPAIWWGWAPEIEYIPLAEDPAGNLIQFLLPALIMGAAMSGTTMRITRTMMLEVLRQDYIRTAWAKGLGERTVIIRHALKNALIPVITIIGMSVPLLIGGSVIMEQIFGLPGVGRLFIVALNTRDYPMISGINLAIAVAVLFMNLLVDLAYGWLDPRIQYR